MKTLTILIVALALIACLPPWWSVREEIAISMAPEKQCVIDSLNSIDGIRFTKFIETHNYFFQSELGPGELHIETVSGQLLLASNFNGEGRAVPKAIEENGAELLKTINAAVRAACASEN